jgi:hypothetical protein
MDAGATLQGGQVSKRYKSPYDNSSLKEVTPLWVTELEAIQLMLHHLTLAAMYFAATPREMITPQMTRKYSSKAAYNAIRQFMYMMHEDRGDHRK